MNITSLIDVVFLLVIFFLVTTHFSRTDSSEAVDLPTAVQGQDDEQVAPRRVVVTVLSDGSLRVGGQARTIDEVDALIADEAARGAADLAVQIRADESAAYSAVEPILLSCARHGVTQFGFKTTPP